MSQSIRMSVTLRSGSDTRPAVVGMSAPRHTVSPMTAATAHQPTLAEIGTPLSQVTFVVVDLETTGGSPANAAITEIGAVKVRGGEVLGEFQTLVDPGTDIPPFIATLTGITTAMVREAPTIAAETLSFCSTQATASCARVSPA